MRRVTSVAVLALSLMTWGCGGDDKKTGASGDDEASQGSENTLEGKKAELQALNLAIMEKSKAGQMPTPEEMQKLAKLSGEILEMTQAVGLAKPEATRGVPMNAVPGAAVRAGVNALENAKNAFKRNAPAMKALGGAAMDKMVDGGAQALDAIGKNGKINMKNYKAGVGKQIDALESMGGDSDAIRGARDAMKNMPARMPEMPAGMPAMPKMPSMPSGF
jgi:hypothetical protein